MIKLMLSKLLSALFTKTFALWVAGKVASSTANKYDDNLVKLADGLLSADDKKVVEAAQGIIELGIDDLKD